MAQITDQIAAVGKTQFDAILKTAEFTADSVQKLAEVQFDAAKESYSEAAATLRKLSTTQNAGDWSTFAAGSVQPLWDKTVDYTRAVYGVVSAAQAQYASLVEQQVAELNKSVVLALDAAAKSAPAGSESGINVLRSAMHSVNAWYETVAKTAKQISAATEANLSAVADQVAGAGRKKAA
ncbi:MAG TPA: phasin family protein [Burkholderiales bacterium]|nr:phasin family protein [Burkholderiales bacterium]